MAALKGAKDQLYYKILPRTLSFQQVLHSVPEECEFSVSDLHQDDFYMFRYELHTINKKHFYQDEKNSSVYLLGQNPLSNLNGVPVKDLIKDLKKADNYKYRE